MRIGASQGTSLLELLLGVALIAILSYFSIPRSNGNSLKREVDSLLATINELISSSRSKELPIELIFSGTSYHSEASKGGVSVKHNLSPGIQIDRHSPIRFYPNGVSSPTTLTIRSADKQCALVLSLRGRVRVTCS